MITFATIVSAAKWLALPLLIMAGGTFYKYYPDLKQDNPAEEHIEIVIYELSGQDIDLSPDTEETDGKDK